MIDIKTSCGDVERCRFEGPPDDVMCDVMIAINLIYNGMKGMSEPLAAQFRQSITSAVNDADGILWTDMPVAGTGNLVQIGIRPKEEQR